MPRCCVRIRSWGGSSICLGSRMHDYKMPIAAQIKVAAIRPARGISSSAFFRTVWPQSLYHNAVWRNRACPGAAASAAPPPRCRREAWQHRAWRKASKPARGAAPHAGARRDRRRRLRAAADTTSSPKAPAPGSFRQRLDADVVFLVGRLIMAAKDSAAAPEISKSVVVSMMRMARCRACRCRRGGRSSAAASAPRRSSCCRWRRETTRCLPPWRDARRFSRLRPR